MVCRGTSIEIKAVQAKGMRALLVLRCKQFLEFFAQRVFRNDRSEPSTPLLDDTRTYALL